MRQEQLESEYGPELVVDEVQEDTKDVQESIIDLSYEVMKDQGGKKLNFRGFSFGFRKKTKDKLQAVLKEREPYLKMVELYGTMKMPQCNGTLEAKTSVRNLMERLKNESPFGYGDYSVIACENDIARCLDELEQNVQGLFSPEIAEEASDVIVINCRTIQAKLKIRAELKRK